MKKLRRPDDKRPVIAASDHVLNEIVLPSVFRLFKEDKFRELAHFKKLPVSEHDRIFNELEVAGVCLAIFYLRVLKTLARPEDYHFWQGTEMYLPKQLQKMLISYGVDGSNAKLVKQLVDMRCTEYEELGEKARDDSHIQDSKPDILSSEIKWVAAITQAVAVGTVDHIRRGKLEEGDPLIRHLFTWLLSLQKKVSRFVKNL